MAAALFSLALHGATIKGRVFNPSYNEGEPFATVRVFGAVDDRPVTSVLTDIDGYFTVETDAGGNYRLEISSVARKPVCREISVQKDEVVECGNIEMKEDSQSLDEIVVVAQRPLVQMSADQMTYNVAEDTDSRTFTLLDMLRKVPMVTVDGEDNITVNGSSDFRVYVDGKPSLLFSTNPGQIFKSMPASAVLKVEVVTNPGARYDAEGTGGVLNLVMNKEVAGDIASTKACNVSLGARVNNRGYGGNLYAGAQAGRLTTSVNIIHNDSRPGTSDFTTRREQGDLDITSAASSKPRVQFTMGNLSVEYTIDSLTTLGASFALNRFSTGAHASVSTAMNQDRDCIYAYTSDSRIDALRQGLNGSLNLNRSFGASRRNELNITYQIARETNNNMSDNIFDVTLPAGNPMPARMSDTRQKTTEQIVLADLTSKPCDNHSITCGLKGTFRNATARNTYFVDNEYDADGSLDYGNNSRILAAYSEYAYRGTRFNAKAGVRYEHTFQSISYKSGGIDDYSDNYGNLVPSASAGYNLTSTTNLGLNYTMRISRPGISYLNPYVNRADPTSVSYGNPLLAVEKTHNLSAVYNLFTSKFIFNATLSYSHTGNGIEQYSFPADGVMYTTYGNIVKRNSVALNTYLNWLIGTSTRIFLNGGISYVDLRSAELNACNNGLQGNLMLGVQQTLPWNIKANAFLMTSTKNRTLQGWSTGFGLASINFSKSFINDRLGITLGVNSGLAKGGHLKMETHVDTSEFSNHTTIRVPITSVNLGVTFRFGSNARIKDIKNKFIDNDYIDTRSQMEEISNSESTSSAL